MFAKGRKLRGLWSPQHRFGFRAGRCLCAFFSLLSLDPSAVLLSSSSPNNTKWEQNRPNSKNSLPMKCWPVSCLQRVCRLLIRFGTRCSPSGLARQSATKNGWSWKNQQKNSWLDSPKITLRPLIWPLSSTYFLRTKTS